ncbi:hypothetical protein BGX26_009249 [Mortierella sp. AD094]|nr:hypothetical protein BGX26_009249 [Mortierella sp. AD094]
MIKMSIETVIALHKTAHSQKRRKNCVSNDDQREAEANDKIPDDEDISFEEGSIRYILSKKYKESPNINTSKQPAPIQLAASLIVNTLTANMMDWFSEHQWALLRTKVKTIGSFSFTPETVALIDELKSTLHTADSHDTGAFSRAINLRLSQVQYKEITLVLEYLQLWVSGLQRHSSQLAAVKEMSEQDLQAFFLTVVYRVFQGSELVIRIGDIENKATKNDLTKAQKLTGRDIGSSRGRKTDLLVK